MADSVIPITAGSGSDVKTFFDAASDHIQYVRPHTATASVLDAWTTATAGAASRVAADETRVALTFKNTSTATVWIRPDATIPTAATCYESLLSGETYEVPERWVELAWSVGSSASGA